MSLMSIILTLIIWGVVLWVIETLLPMDEKFKRVINVIVSVAILIFVLQSFGLIDTRLRLR